MKRRIVPEYPVVWTNTARLTESFTMVARDDEQRFVEFSAFLKARNEPF